MIGEGVSELLDGTPYRPIKLLGKGGMGEVWEAQHAELDSRFVVKVMLPALASNPQHADRMRLEAQAMARLKSPHLVHVSDFGTTAAGRPYFVMERLAGRTLADELRARVALPVAEACEVTIQLLTALEAVHGAGLIHRDVKLANIFYCDQRQGRRLVKLLDFGIVKLNQVQHNQLSLEPLAVPTSTGALLGTPSYIAPEQARGRGVDHRTDLYSAGLVLYALLAVCGPFDFVTNSIEMIYAQLNAAAEPPSAHSPQSLPAALDRVVLHALDKDPERRFQTAGQFAADLHAVVGMHAANASPRVAVAPVVRTTDTGTERIAPVALATKPLGQRNGHE